MARPRTHKCHRRHHDDPSVVSTMPMPNQAAHRAPWCFRVGGPVALLSIAVVAIQLRCCSCGRGKPQAPRSIDRSCGLDPRRSQRAHRLSDVSCGRGAIERGTSTHTPHAAPARKQFIRFISERRRATTSASPVFGIAFAWVLLGQGTESGSSRSSRRSQRTRRPRSIGCIPMMRLDRWGMGIGCVLCVSVVGGRCVRSVADEERRRFVHHANDDALPPYLAAARHTSANQSTGR